MLLLVVAPPREAECIRNALEPLHEGLDARFVDTTQGLAALHERLWDAIILVNPEPAPDSSLLLDTYVNLAHGAPVIVLVDAIGEDAAAELVRRGATDVVSFARIIRLPTVIEREVRAKLKPNADTGRNRLQAQKMEAFGTLAGGVAHDFNNILSAIMCSADVLLHDLRRSPHAGEMPEIVFELQMAAQRGADLVRQIQTFSRRGNNRRAALDIASAMQETIDSLRKNCPAHVDIRMDIRANPWVFADAVQMQQLLTNLYTNRFQTLTDAKGIVSFELDSVAIDATFAQTVEGLREGRYAHIRVTDNGPGMDAETMEHIFEPFFTNKSTGRGTGLGMAVVQGIVIAHDGTIHVQSAMGGGTTVDVWFPAVRGETHTNGLQKASVVHGAGEHILIVDDEAGLARIFGRLLQGIGYQVTVQTESTKALEIFEKDPSSFHAVLVDLNMPPPGGIEVAQRVHALRPNLPICIMSGYSDGLGITLPNDLGIVAILQKPITRETLAKELRRVLDLPTTT